MKIIKQGKKLIDLLKGECNECGLELECSKNEAKYFSDLREGSYWSINCPNCQGLIYLDLIKFAGESNAN